MKTCIICQIKDEREYIKEWADHHLKIGFDHIFLYEDYESVSHADIFESYDNVDVIPMQEAGIYDYKSTFTQRVLYNTILQKLKNGNTYDWAAFIDADEFIMLEEGYTLEKLCDEFKEYNGIWLGWKMFNANGHIKHPEGSVVENYTNELKDEFNHHQIDCNQWNKKSFVNLHKAEGFWNIHIIADGVDTKLQNNPHFKPVYNKAWINHYFSKSWEDFCYRMQKKGNMRNCWRTYDLFFKQNPELVKEMPKLLNEIRYEHTNGTMYISKIFGIISGGNIRTIEKIDNGELENIPLIEI